MKFSYVLAIIFGLSCVIKVGAIAALGGMMQVLQASQQRLFFNALTTDGEYRNPF